MASADLFELEGTVNRLKELYLRETGKHLCTLEDMEARIELHKICLRGVRRELGAIDAERFAGLIKIIESVLIK